MKTWTTSMRTIVSLGALAGAFALTNDARGSDAPTFSDLPVGRLTGLPQKKVAWVSARESVPGVFLVSPSQNAGLPPQQRMLSITTDPRIAAALKGNEGLDVREQVPSGCVSQMRPSGFGEAAEKETEWDENLATEAGAYPRSADSPMSGVTAVHTERIVEQNGSVTLESVDAWVDPATRGAKLIAKASLPLKLLRTPAFGMKVYAGRDERPDGKRFVQFVVVRPQTSHMERTSEMWSMRQDGNVAHSSGCGHQRVAIAVDGKGGETATIVATVVLPALDENGKEVKEPKPTTTPPTPVAGKSSPKVRPAFFGVKGDPGSAKESEVRSRMMHIQVSVSQTARDKEPLVSASSSWGGREQVDRFIEDDSGAL